MNVESVNAVIDQHVERCKEIYWDLWKEKKNTWTTDELTDLQDALIIKATKYAEEGQPGDLYHIMNYCWMILEREVWLSEAKEVYGDETT